MRPKLFHPKYLIRYIEKAEVPTDWAMAFKEINLGKIEHREAIQKFKEFLDKNKNAIQPELVRVLSVANRESIESMLVS